MTSEELEIITAGRSWEETSGAESVPLVPLVLDMAATPSVWVLMACDFCNNWGINSLSTQGPTFMYEVLGMDIINNSIYNMLPQLTRSLFAFLTGFISDLLIARNYLGKYKVYT